jgi:hypothetical protein
LLSALILPRDWPRGPEEISPADGAAPDWIVSDDLAASDWAFSAMKRSAQARSWCAWSR